ncbi:MAG: hypothetical protein U9R50_10095, partial [Campylobacterota bacterium]|nr:hypothetical protein [Campylobacterota bacterium]
MSDKMIASEALYGFAGWLTSRDCEVTASSHHDAAIWAELVGAFIEENKLVQPRDGWEHNLTHPSGECSGRVITSFEKDIISVLDELKQVLLSKNKKYGNSAL